jgi:cytochrome oxidase Cu insertion factor (SCO1/SenC/PrrC family)
VIRSCQRFPQARDVLAAAALCFAAAACSAVGSQPESLGDGLLHTEYGYEVAPPDPLTREATPFERMEGYFPNTELTTHDGRTVYFYDDLIVGQVVLINFMYTQCTGI